MTNTFLNYALIYGHFGFATMGVYGAAIATNIAAGVQLAVNLAFAYGKKLPAGASAARDGRTRPRLCQALYQDGAARGVQ